MKNPAIQCVQESGNDDLQASFIQRALAGDGTAFCDLVEPMEERLYRQAFHMCGCPQNARDLVQETLIVAWNTLEKYDQSCRMTTWLYSIMLRKHWNQSRSAWKRKIQFFGVRAKELTPISAGEDSATSGFPAPDSIKIASEKHQKLQSMVQTLPRKLEEVISLRFFSDASLEEISVLVGCPLGTVKSRLFNAIEKLRAMNLTELK